MECFSRKWWKSQDSVHKPQPFWRERRAEAVSNRGPSAYLPNALPLGQTGPLFKYLFYWSMIAYIALFSALLSRLTALACDSTGMTCFFIARFFSFSFFSFRDLWHNELWQRLEDGCRRPVLGVCLVLKRHDWSEDGSREWDHGVYTTILV